MESASTKARSILNDLHSIIEEQESTIFEQQSQIADLQLEVHRLSKSRDDLLKKINLLEKNGDKNSLTKKQRRSKHSFGKKKSNTPFNHLNSNPVGEGMPVKLERTGSGASQLEQVVKRNASTHRNHLEEQDAAYVRTGKYELSSDLKDKQVEALRNIYGEKSEQAARIIQEAYRNHKMRNQFKKIRRSCVRRLTVDNIHASSREKLKAQLIKTRSKSFDHSGSDYDELSYKAKMHPEKVEEEAEDSEVTEPALESNRSITNSNETVGLRIDDEDKQSEGDTDTPKAVLSPSSQTDETTELSQEEIVKRILSDAPITGLNYTRKKKKHGYEKVVLPTAVSSETPEVKIEPVVVRLRHPPRNRDIQPEVNGNGDVKKRDSPVWLRTSSQLSLNSNENDAEVESIRSSDTASTTSDLSSVVSEGFQPNFFRRSMLSVRSSIILDSDVFRKRQYRIGLNLFNMKPSKGLKFLIDHKFVANSAPAVATFLLNRKGLSRQMVGEYLGNTQKVFNQEVLDSVCDLMDFSNMELDEALRAFQSQIKVQGEAQKVERLVEAFSQRYCTCNPKMVESLQNPDSIFVLAFAIIMLNTDLHSPNMKHEKRMSEQDFIRNLRGVDNGDDLSEILLKNIYNRIKEKELTTTDDHMTSVLQVESCIVGKKPVLAVPHRRLVCFVRMFQVIDPSKPQRHGLHQREIFLFNDLILIMKILQKKKGGTSYTLKQSISLHGLSFVVFEGANYAHGIRFINSIDNTVLINLNAPNEHDRKKFIGDVRECIAEVQQMESLRIEAELERAHATSPTEGRNHSFLSTDSRKLSSSLQNLKDAPILAPVKNADHRPISMYNLNANCNNNNNNLSDVSISKRNLFSGRNSSPIAAFGSLFGQSVGKRFGSTRGRSKWHVPISPLALRRCHSNSSHITQDDSGI